MKTTITCVVCDREEAFYTIDEAREAGWGKVSGRDVDYNFCPECFPGILKHLRMWVITHKSSPTVDRWENICEERLYPMESEQRRNANDGESSN